MKKLLLLITALFILASVEGQILRYSNYTAPAPPEEEEEVIPPSFLTSDGYTAAWYIAEEANLTLDNDSVSTWQDMTSNNRDLTQALEANRPVWNDGGYVTIAATTGLATGAFTFDQPCFYYAVIYQDTYTPSGYIFAPYTSTSIRIRQHPTSSSSFEIYAGTWWQPVEDDSQLGEWQLLRILLNGANSRLVINGNSDNTGDVGATNPSGFRLGNYVGSNSANVSFKEIILRTGTESSENEAAIVEYLRDKYNLW